jgi:hypothetical protein
MKESKVVAYNIFKRFPKENKVFVTSDGQAFLNEMHAKNHAIQNRTGKELKIETFLREEANGNSDGGNTTRKKAAELISEIKALTEMEALQAILDRENAGEKRKSIIEAAEKKITELSKSE